MNAISSSINKGAVKVAPKAGGARRSRHAVQKGSGAPLPSPAAERSVGLNAGRAAEAVPSTPGVPSRLSHEDSQHAQSYDQPREGTREEGVEQEEPELSDRVEAAYRATTSGPPQVLSAKLAVVPAKESATQYAEAERPTAHIKDFRPSVRNIDVPIEDSAQEIVEQSNILDQDFESDVERDTAGVGSAQTARTQARTSESPSRARRRMASNRKGREPTPEEAESEVIDVTETRMLDLCKDLRKGKKSSRYMQFVNIVAERKRLRRAARSADVPHIPDQATSGVAPQERAASVQQTKNEQLDVEEHYRIDGRQGEGENDQEEDDNHNDDDDDEEEEEGSGRPFLPSLGTSAPQVRIVDGKIVLDVGSLQVDRAARDAAGRDTAIEYVEENPLEKVVNSRSYSKHKPGARWDAQETELFYTGLRQWGTDFAMISGMFPFRTRKQIKNKFNIEERKHADLVTKALIKSEPVDLAAYSQICATDFRPVSDYEANLAQLRVQFELEREEASKEAQQRKAEVVAELEGAPMQADLPKKSRKRAAAGAGIEVVGDIEEVVEQERLEALRAAQSSDEDE